MSLELSTATQGSKSTQRARPNELPRLLADAHRRIAADVQKKATQWFSVATNRDWKLEQVAIAFTGSLVPSGAFWLEHRLRHHAQA